MTTNADAPRTAAGKAADVTKSGADEVADVSDPGAGKAADVPDAGAGKAGDAMDAGAGRAADVVGPGAGKAADVVGPAAGKVADAVGPGAGKAPRRRAPAGAAVLREDVTEAIRVAVFEELAAVGYARMSIEGIARRAGVGKTAVYRRWRSKLHLVLDLVSAVAVQGLPAPDTGSLEGDLRLLYEVTSRALRHPVAGQIIPDLQAEAARNPDIAEAMQQALRQGQQGVAAGIVAAAAARGEIREGVNEDLALDLMSGPLYWRAVVVRGPKLPKGYLAGLARATAAALKAL